VWLERGELRALKVFSTPGDPSLAVLEAVRAAGAGSDLELRHGTTVGTNTLLEGKGARVAFVTTAGFEDTIAIGRQTRERLYDWFAPVPVCLVPKELRFGVPERVSAEGEILLRPTEAELEELAEKVRASGAEAAAVSLLFSFLQPETEERVERALASLGLRVSVSHRILPEFREYERASTTVVNAYLAPRMARYLTHLADRTAAEFAGSRVTVMQSSGGLIDADLAAREPVRTVLSGPAGGVIGACKMAAWAGFERIIGFDMGGTSTDVFFADLATGGAERTREAVVAGMAIGVPMLDIHTVGAGGGSIASFDAGGLLRVGPESAGADPGPICFGKGERATVTDANLLLGRLDEGSFLGGTVGLNIERTERLLMEQKGPLGSVQAFAAGILRVVESRMEKAIRVISMERGHDPRECVLVAFGGGGPLHACSLARLLRIPKVLIPAHPGALSAVGILLADAVRDYSRTVMLAGDRLGEISGVFAELVQGAYPEKDALLERSLDVRYRGQGYELNVAYSLKNPEAALAAFHALHRQRYGFADERRAVEIVNVRLRVSVAGEAYEPRRLGCVRGDGLQARIAAKGIVFDGAASTAWVYRRDDLRPGDRFEGPAMISEYSSATVVPPGCQVEVDGLGNLVIAVGVA
jgi:N-methylhydantoinase A